MGHLDIFASDPPEREVNCHLSTNVIQMRRMVRMVMEMTMTMMMVIGN